MVFFAMSQLRKDLAARMNADKGTIRTRSILLIVLLSAFIVQPVLVQPLEIMYFSRSTQRLL